MSEDSTELDVFDESFRPKKSIVEQDGKWVVLADKHRELEFPRVVTPAWVEDQLSGSQWRIIKGNGIRLNAQLISSMSKDASKGLSKRAILARHGFTPDRWSEWARKALQGYEPYYLWSQCMQYSAAQVEQDVMQDIRLQAKGDFKAAKWIMERINPDEYGPAPKEQTVNIHGDVNNTQNNTTQNETSVNYMSDEHALEVARLLKNFGVLPELDAVQEAEVVEDD